MKQQATFPPEDQTPDSGEPILFTQAKSLRDSVNGATVNGAKAFRGRGRGRGPSLTFQSLDQISLFQLGEGGKMRRPAAEKPSNL